MPPAPLKAFIIYARDDSSYKEEFVRQLSPFIKKGLIAKWDDSHLLPGEDWEKRILKELEKSDLVFMLVSAHSLFSEFIQTKELKMALEKKKAGISQLIPILVRDCMHEMEDELQGLQMLPLNEQRKLQAVAAWQDSHSAWAAVCRDLLKLINDVQAKIETAKLAFENEKAEKVKADRQRQRDEAAWKSALEEVEKAALLDDKIAAIEVYLDKYSLHAAEAEQKIADLEALETKRKIEEKQKSKAPPVKVLTLKELGKSFDYEPDMVFIKGGSFIMGSNEGKSWEKPVHEVKLDDYYIGRFQVTQAQWRAVMGTNPSRFKGDNLPVVSVSWDDVQVFIKIINEKSGRKYRLPTEAEWEYAARGGSLSKGFVYSGSNDIDEIAWYEKNSGNKTHPVGLKRPNELGIYDMSGNVWEWCEDWFDIEYYNKSAVLNPAGSEKGAGRVYRGGSYHVGSQRCRCSCRDWFASGRCYNDLGFRLACSPQ